jgi:hypothetical protein
MENDNHVYEVDFEFLCDPRALKDLAEGDSKSLAIIKRLLIRNRTAVAVIIAKELRGSRIWELYETICGRNMDRFLYHIFLELPNQSSGRLRLIPADYADNIGLTREGVENHFRARQNGKPNSFWAFEDPPTEKDYEYPIVILSFNIQIG